MKNVAVSTGIGVPLGQVVVWILETFYLAAPVPSEVAIAIGTVLTGLLTGAGMLLSFYLLRRKATHDDPTDPPSA